MFLLVYVDDIIIASSSSSAVDSLLDKLKFDFALKDLGALSYFLRIEVTKVVDGILSKTEQVYLRSTQARRNFSLQACAYTFSH
jgi:hypothetical protein